MARKREIKKVHPVTAMEAFRGFYDDVTTLFFEVHNAIDFLGDVAEGKSDGRKVAEVLKPRLKVALDNCRQWIETEQ